MNEIEQVNVHGKEMHTVKQGGAGFVDCIHVHGNKAGKPGTAQT